MAGTEEGRVQIGPQNIVGVSIVVEDLRKAVEEHWEFLGIGPWQLYTLRPPQLTNTTIGGKPEPYSLKVATTQIGNLLWELVQPLTGQTIERQFLDQKGSGLYKVVVAVEDYDRTIEDMRRRGVGVLMGGCWQGISYSYLDTEKKLGAIVEISKAPSDWVMPQPEGIYPRPQND